MNTKEMESVLQDYFVGVCKVIALCVAVLAISGTFYIIYLILVNMRVWQ